MVSINFAIVGLVGYFETYPLLVGVSGYLAGYDQNSLILVRPYVPISFRWSAVMGFVLELIDLKISKAGGAFRLCQLHKTPE